MSEVNKSDTLLTLREAATRLRVSERTVRRLVANKEFPARKVGRAYRVRASDLDAWLDNQG